MRLDELPLKPNDGVSLVNKRAQLTLADGTSLDIWRNNERNWWTFFHENRFNGETINCWFHLDDLTAQAVLHHLLPTE